MDKPDKEWDRFVNACAVTRQSMKEQVRIKVHKKAEPVEKKEVLPYWKRLFYGCLHE